MLLSLTADLHAASRDPQRWPQAWAALCQWFDCPDVFGSCEMATTEVSVQLNSIAACSTQARLCAQKVSGRSLCLDENKRRNCLALVDHLDHALATHQALVPHFDALSSQIDLFLLKNPYLVALDAMPFSVFVCDLQRHILFANTLGKIELVGSTWLRRVDERIVGASPLFERRIASALAASDAHEAEHRLWLIGQHQHEVDLVWRRVAAHAGDTHLILRLVNHGRQDQADMTKLALALGLSSRQLELAKLLLGGCTLTDAAKCMGIVRGSANQLLKHLFTATGTRRQPELVAFLSRRLAS